jgi:phage-related minor tail protein
MSFGRCDMANNIKGITIEIGGDTGPLSTALKGVNKTAGDLQSELKEVNKQLKFDPKNTDLLKQKEDLLKQSTQALEEKQKTLKTAVEQAHTAFGKGDLGADKVRAVEREYEKVTSQLKDTKTQLNEVESHVGTFSEKVKAKFSTIKDSIKSAFSAEHVKAALGAIGVAAGTFLKSSIDEAGEAEKANADLAQTLQSTGGAAGMTMESLEKLSQSMAENTTFSDDAVKSGESMLLTFTNIGQDVFPQATAAVLDFAQKMGTDPKEAALTLGKALNDPADGLSKLTRSGVTFTDQQKEQIKAMQTAGDTAGAQKLMLDELNKEFGGQAAAAADTYEGKQKQMANTMTEIKETIGSALMPMLASLLKTVTPIIQAVAKFVTDHPKVTAGILAVIAVIGTLVGGLSLLTTVTGAFGIAMDGLLGPIALVVAAIAAVAAGAALVIKNWGPISDFFKNLWDGIKSVAASVGSWFAGPFIDFFKNAWKGISNAFSSVGTWFKDRFTDAVNGVKGAWSGVTGFFSGIKDGIAGAFSGIGERIKSAFTSAVDFLRDLPSQALQWGKDMIDNFVSGVKSMVHKVTSAVSNVASKIKSFLHFSEPDEGPLVGFHTWWKDMMNGIAEDINGNMAPVLSATQGVAHGIAGSIKIPAGDLNAGTQVKTAVSAANGGISAAAQNNSISQIDSGLMDKLDGILTAIKNGHVIAVDGKELAVATADAYDQVLGLKKELAKLGAL